MAIGTLQTEKEFLINLAVSQFNDQYGRDIDPALCAIHSIAPDFGTDLGYEIKTNITTDFVRLRLYLGIDRRDVLQIFRLETDKSFAVNQLGDEVYVAMGSVSSTYIDNGIYRFRWIAEAVVVEDPIVFLDGSSFTMMTGEPFTFLEAP